MLVGLLARRNGGRGAARSQTQAGEKGGRKPENERDGSVSGCIRALRGAGGFREVKYPPAAVI